MEAVVVGEVEVGSCRRGVLSYGGDCLGESVVRGSVVLRVGLS